ncbi:MAG: hypothetical protein ABSE89_01225 [Sedimentisphaerales bacterium]
MSPDEISLACGRTSHPDEVVAALHRAGGVKTGNGRKLKIKYRK